MPSIDVLNVNQWRGVMPRSGRNIVRIPAFANVDGAALVASAWATEPGRISAAFIGIPDAPTTDALWTALLAYMADPLPPSGITVVDQFGFIYTGVIVVGVSATPSIQGDGTYRLDSNWQFELQTIHQ